MIKVIFLLFVSVLSLNVSAEQYVYESLGQPSISIDMKNKIFMIDDAEGRLKSCELNGLELCFKIGKAFIAIPDDHKTPLKINLPGGAELVFLPIVKSISVLGKKIEGFEVDIHNSKGRDLDSSLFFNSEHGVLMFVFDGNVYWSSSVKGLASKVNN